MKCLLIIFTVLLFILQTQKTFGNEFVNTRRTKYDSSGNMIFYINYQYDSVNRIIKEDKFDNNDSLIRVLIYERQDYLDYIIIRLKVSFGEDSGNFEEYFLNSEGDTLKINVSTHLFQGYSIYEYNLNSENSRISVFDTDSNLIRYIKIEYDSIGNLIKEEWYNSDSNLYDYYYYSYEIDTIINKFVMKQKIYFNPIDSQYILIYCFNFTYDLSGNIVKKSNCYDSINIIYVYDIYGNLTRINEYDRNSSLIFYEEYEYNEINSIKLFSDICDKKTNIISYPNPFNSSTLIILPYNNTPINLMIYNINGNLVYEKSNIILRNIAWRAKNMPSGLYVIKVFNKNKGFSKKIFLSK